IELRVPAHLAFSTTVFPSDAAANIICFIPVGMVFANAGVAGATLISALIALAAETSQLFMMHRDPSLVDVVGNAVGALAGAVIATQLRIETASVRIGRPVALAAAALAAALTLVPWINALAPPNPRGLIAPGDLEAHWTLDDAEGGRVHDL